MAGLPGAGSIAPDFRPDSEIVQAVEIADANGIEQDTLALRQQPIGDAPLY